MDFIIDHLQQIDRLSIVSFHDKAKRLTNLKRLTPDNKLSIKMAVKDMIATGETNIAQAMDFALAILD